MSIFTIKGKKKLKGGVKLSGAKNVALKVLLAALLTEDKVYLKNIPLQMFDVAETIRMLRALKVEVEIKGKDEVAVDSSKLSEWKIPLDQNFQIRTTLLMLGVLLGRFGKARVPLPGGCKIGERKFDLHLYALRRLGANLKVTSNYIEASCQKKLKGAEIEFPMRTTGGTENTILAAVLAAGKTVIKNAHTNLPVRDLVLFLRSMGAKISIIGSGLIEVQGVANLHGTTHKITFDDVEAITFIIAAALTGGDITIKNCSAEQLAIPLIYLKESGVKYTAGKNSLRVVGNKRYTPIDLSTGSYPGISTDYQPLFAVFATQAEGTSHITDIRHKERFQYVSELAKMGASIKKRKNTIAISGPKKLQGCRVTAFDLRAGAALVVAALCAEGKTVLSSVEQIDRGYEEIEKKLDQLGTFIKRGN